MNTLEIIKALRLQGHKVSARKRTDGGWIITKIDRTKYKGAEGNMRARDLLGISYSKKRLEQARYNVTRFIRGKKKQRTLEDEIKKELRRVQREWRKHNVKAEITAFHVKKHIKEAGMLGALDYLRRRRRYGQGFAYAENVYAVSNYIRCVAKSIRDIDLVDRIEELASMMDENAENIRFDTLSKIHDMWYDVAKLGFDEEITRTALEKSFQLLASD